MLVITLYLPVLVICYSLLMLRLWSIIRHHTAGLTGSLYYHIRVRVRVRVRVRAGLTGLLYNRIRELSSLVTHASCIIRS